MEKQCSWFDIYEVWQMKASPSVEKQCSCSPFGLANFGNFLRITSSLTDEGFLVHLPWKSNVLGRPRAFGSRLRWMSPTWRQLSEEATNTLSIIWGKPINKQWSIINYLMKQQTGQHIIIIIWGATHKSIINYHYQLSGANQATNKLYTIYYMLKVRKVEVCIGENIFEDI